MRGITTLFALLLAGAAGAAAAQQGMSPPSTGDLSSGRDLGTGGGPTAGGGIGGGVTGDAGPDRDLGTGAAGPLRQGNRLGSGGGITNAPTQMAIDDPAFLRLDTNRNGAIDRAEAEIDTALAERFAATDVDRDGSLSLSEFQTLSREPP